MFLGLVFATLAVVSAQHGFVPPPMLKHPSAFPLYPDRPPVTVAKRDGYPETLTLGSLTIPSCMQPNMYGIEGIYCAKIPMKLDRANSSDPRTINVTFVVHPSLAQLSTPPAQRKAIFLPLGGPGGSIDVDGLLAMTLLANVGLDGYDFVSADVRGAGRSCKLSCYAALAAHTAFPYSGSLPSVYAAGYASAAEDCLQEIATTTVPEFMTPCIDGSSSPDPRQQRIELLPFLSTRVFADDFKSFHDLAGYAKVILYGMSFGTGVCEVYAGHFPSDVAGMILDSGFDMLSDAATRNRNFTTSGRSALAILAGYCARDSDCAADACGDVAANPVVCAAIALARFELALSPLLGWPKHLDYPYVDPQTGAVTVVQLDLHRSAEAVIGYSFRAAFRAHLVRILLAASHGDYLPLAKLVFGAYNIDPRDPASAPIDSYLAVGSSYLFPHVVAADNTWRWTQLPNPPLTPTQLGTQFATAVGMPNIRSVLGETSVLVQAFSSALGNPNSPLYSVSYQNETLTTVPGWHGNYPVLIAHSNIDGQIPPPNSDLLYNRYSASGQTGIVKLLGASHVVSTIGATDGYTDPGYLLWVFILQQALLQNRWIQGPRVFSLQTPFPKYTPLAPEDPVAITDLLAVVEGELVSLPEWWNYFTLIAACSKGGIVSWGNVLADGKEELVLSSCAFTSEYTVSGIATFDWASPDIFHSGANFAFEKASVLEVSTGITRCFSYSHVAGQDPVQAEVNC